MNVEELPGFTGNIGTFMDHEQLFQTIQKVVKSMKPDGESKGFSLRDTSPLSNEIINDPFPDKFKMPPLSLYNGSMNPMSHVNTYKGYMTKGWQRSMNSDLKKGMGIRGGLTGVLSGICLG